MLAGLLTILLPLHALATTVVPPEFPTLVNESDYIVHAIVRDVRSEKRERNGNPRIVTLVELDIREVVAGHPPAVVVLELLGGRVGDEVMTVSGQPQFAPGDEEILFVKNNGRSISPLYGMMFGRYHVRTDPATGRRLVTRDSGEPLATPDAVATAMHTDTTTTPPADGLTPTEFIRAIRSAIPPPSQAPE